MALYEKMGITPSEYDNMSAYDKHLSLMVINRLNEVQEKVINNG